MEKIQKYSTHWGFNLGIVLFVFLAWLIPYLDVAHADVHEIIGQVLIAVIGCALLILFKNTLLTLQLVLFFPFMFSRSFTFNEFPLHLIAVIALIIIGFIVHFILYKVKLQKPAMIYSYIALGVSCIFGGLLYDYKNKAVTMLIFLGIVALILLLYTFFSSTIELDFKKLSFMMCLLGLLFVLQSFVTGICHFDILLTHKGSITPGWAPNTNNLATMLLCTIPFTIYTCLKEDKKYLAILYAILFVFEIMFLIITYSRGGIFAGFITLLALDIYLIVNKTSRKRTLIVNGIGLGIASLFVITVAIVDTSLFKSIFGNLTAVDFESLNGRTEIYETYLPRVKYQPIFGFGILNSFLDSGRYLWAHNTFLQALYTTGALGLGCMIYHFVEKYMLCFKKINLEKIILLAAFLAPDIYGFSDVTYYLISFMIVLFVLTVTCGKIFKNDQKEPKKEEINAEKLENEAKEA